jgi:hypothetical protein
LVFGTIWWYRKGTDTNGTDLSEKYVILRPKAEESPDKKRSFATLRMTRKGLKEAPFGTDADLNET